MKKILSTALSGFVITTIISLTACASSDPIMNEVDDNTSIVVLYNSESKIEAVEVCNSEELNYNEMRSKYKEAERLKVFVWSHSKGFFEKTNDVELRTIQNSEEKQIMITIGNNSFMAVLSDNSSASAFYELLKDGEITLEMSDYGSFEKVGTLPVTLPKNDEKITTVPGDIILYQGNKLTIYYDQNTWDFTHIGKINGLTQRELIDALGDGTVTAEFSIYHN